MSHLIIGHFSQHDEAAAAAAALRQARFGEDDIRLVNSSTNHIPGSDDAGSVADALVSALVRDGLWRTEAVLHADWLSGGGSLVTVRASFGRARRAAAILRAAGAADVRSYVHAESRDATSGQPAFSAFFGWPTLSNDTGAVSRMFGLPPLSSQVTPLSSMFGWPLLSRQATPLSSMLGLPLLLKRSR